MDHGERVARAPPFSEAAWNRYNAAIEVYELSCSAPLLPLIAPRPTLGESDTVPAGIRKSRTSTHIHYPDNPFDIVEAMSSGEYVASLDVNGDRQVDMTDLELSVEHFGAGTMDDFMPSVLADAYPYPMQAPHMIDIPNACGRCHSMDGLPWGMLTGAGQENLCLSCHTAGLWRCSVNST